MARTPTTIDEYLVTLSGERLVALERLRQTIRSIIPGRRGVRSRVPSAPAKIIALDPTCS
jgi:hypothetical protein